MKFPITVALAAMLLIPTVSRGKDLPRSTPEEQGISSAAVLSFVEAADSQFDSLHSFMLVRHGHVVAEGWWAPYHAEARHSLYSLSKSFASTAIGLAIEEGKLSLHDPVVKFFPEDLRAAPSDHLQAMRVSDLLRMATGHQSEPPRTDSVPWTRSFLEHPVPFKPGTHFLYNTSATYMQSAIVQKVTEVKLIDYLRPRLFDPLGIENPQWETSPQGISTGGYGLSIRTEDIARFGQLYLQKGKWNGQQLVPEKWISEATARQTATGSNPASDWDQGYGYQFWRCRHGAFRGDGAFGQYCVVLPELDAVIAITSGVKNMPDVLNVVWDRLLPAFHAEPQAPNPEVAAKLKQTLASLRIPPQTGAAMPPKILGKQYAIAQNKHQLEAVRFESGPAAGEVTISLRCNGTEYPTVCRSGDWTRGRTAFSGGASQPVAVSGAWTADDTFTAQYCFYETPFTATVRFKFTGDEVLADCQYNASFGPAADFKLRGTTGPSSSDK
ncbi:serine hydrolase domain-containing protein [Schlesneria sp. T3-172]|uniref:serine hydrolase domain-containing protein n=1 Tax=Schlesneria sphaerica TaxID=3373610 RepID=UPI0037C63D48